ncbi:MAG: class II glutamine amidotransferase [Candidatus Lokiarchaeota archaeon]|nr:class II glutamine amidotransferase [Candidatus Lokiarchaeota archaeon]
MCRMFFKCSLEPFYLDYNILKKYIKSCHWRYLRKYDLLGHHGLGWGFAYLSESDNKLVIKRDISPIYHADWKGLTKIKTRFILVHARKILPWKKNLGNVHPISIKEKYLLTHNGIIKNFPSKKLKNPRLDNIYNETDLDTRKYLCSIINELQEGKDLKIGLESIFKSIEIGAGANAFLFNSKSCNVITNHKNNFNGRHHTLFLSKNKDGILVSTTPLTENAKEIPNHSLMQIDLIDLNVNIVKLEF